MIGSILLCLLPAFLGGTVGHLDATLEFEDDLLSYQFVDIDGQGVQSLCVALRSKEGRRELRILEMTRRGFNPEPRHTISILEDILAYGFADVREEPGRELIFLTRTGAYSYSLTIDGYRNNIARLVTENLLYDVPDSRAFPFWSYTIEAPGSDLILLPGRRDFSVWGPQRGEKSGDGSYEAWTRFDSDSTARDVRSQANRGDGAGLSLSGSGELRANTGDPDGGIFLSESDGSSTLLADAKYYPAPAVVDVNGDGKQDLILQRDSDLEVYLGGDQGFDGSPTRIESLPDYLLGDDISLQLTFAHLNSDDLIDLVAVVKAELKGFENVQMRVFALLNDGKRLLPEEAHQVFRFEGAQLRVEVADVNADGRNDLLVRKFVLPSMLEAVSGLEFELTFAVFFAEKRGARPFKRKPDLNQTETFDENNFGDILKNRKILLDCDGDKIPDLVEVDIQGRIVIRRLIHDSGFFSGDTWEIEKSPWKRFETQGTVVGLRVLDVNGDDLADIVSPSRNALTLLLSTK
ncbi:MAG: hypothetical protein ACI8X5_002881 [Planctomycetota bacterium]|jgi:hypothetical protein